MTRITTITEYDTPRGKTVGIIQDTGMSGSLIYENDEAQITVRFPGEANDYDQWNTHPEDAFMEFLSHFIGDSLN